MSQKREVRDYIKQQLKKGRSKERIEKDLLDVGWREEDVREAFNSLNGIKMKKIIPIIVFVIFVFSVGVGAYFLMDNGDKDLGFEEVDSSRLQIEMIDVPKEGNAYYTLSPLQAPPAGGEDGVELIISDTDSYLDNLRDEDWSQESAKKMLDENEIFFEIFDEALEKDKYQHPILGELYDLDSQSDYIHLRSREFGGANAIRSVYALNEGNEEKAIEEAMNIVRLGQKIWEGKSIIIEQLTARGIQTRGFDTIERILPRVDIDSQKLIDYAEEIKEKSQEIEKEAIITVKMENIFLQNTIENDMADQLTEREMERVDFDKLFQLKDKIVQNEIDIINKPCYRTDEKDRVDLENLNVSEKTKEMTETFNHAITFNGPVCDSKLQFAQIETLFALRAYEIDNGELPESLSNLTPDYIPEIPEDPFREGESLQYSKEERIIYSEKMNEVSKDEREDYKMEI